MKCQCGRTSQLDSDGHTPTYDGLCFECALQSPEYNPYYQPVKPLEDRRAAFNKSKNKGTQP